VALKPPFYGGFYCINTRKKKAHIGLSNYGSYKT
jgi:hypothetical protein